MPNIIPPLLSSTPPPIVDDDEEDEFGDFRSGVDLSFGCDGLSLPSTPEHLQKNKLPEDPLDFNSNNEEQFKTEKDFQDIRKNVINLNTTYNASNSVSEIVTQITDQVDDPKKELHGEKHVSIQNNLPQVKESELNNDKDVTSNSIETNFYGENDVAKLSHEVISVLNVSTLNSENNVNSINSETFKVVHSKTTVSYENDSNNTESLGVKTSFVNKNESFIENSEIHDPSNEVTGVFGDFETNCELKINEPTGDDQNKNVNEISCLNLVEKPLEVTDFQLEKIEKSKYVEEDFDDFCASVDSFNSLQTPSAVNAGCDNNSSDLEKFPTSFSEKVKIDDDSFAEFENYTVQSDDFGDFESSTVHSLETIQNSGDNLKKDEDDGFGDFEQCSFKTVPQNESKDEDEFGDFDSCSTTQIDESINTANKAEEVITSVFPKLNIEEEEYFHTEVLEKDEVFGLLKDIMETNALKFQWVNSSSQKVLLKALNIDIRNILYGPSWSLTVPKFPANPLEPLKPEVLTPEVVSTKPVQQSDSVASFPVEVPTVQFDWTSAGLTNPLDSQSDDQQSAGNINLDWNFLEPTKNDEVRCEWVQKESTSSPAHSLNFEINHDSLSLKSDGEFESQGNICEDVVVKDVLTNMIPLRETHIYEENPIKVQHEVVEEDDFGDFCMSLPVTEKDSKETVTPQLQCLQPTPAEPLKPVVVHTTASATLQIPAKIEWPEPGITEDDIQTIELTYVKQSPVKKTQIKDENVSKKSTIEDDDWTDFISHKETKTSPEKMQNNLQLSVFNLENIQPIKPPVPVITPQGLIQTKLSSSGTINPLTNSPVHSHRPQQKQLTVKPPDGYQPSIISQQFLDSTNQNHSTANISLSNYNLHPSYGQSDSFCLSSAKCSTNSSSSACDDDDWTDFISSQPVPQQQSLSFTPNIIANPNRYDPLREFRLNGDVLSSSGSSNGNKKVTKSSVPNITNLPDLDFVITKNRTFTKK